MSDPEVHLIANDLPYKATDLDPLRALHDSLALSSNDWGSARDFAWIYGIVCGWDDDDPEEESAMPGMAAKFGWTDEQVARLRALHAEFLRMARMTEQMQARGNDEETGIVSDTPEIPAAPIIICEPRNDCADPHVLRWYCMRGHDGAADGVCPLVRCERRGANR